MKLGADRYNSLNQLTVEVTRTETEETEHSFEYGCPVCFFRISADRQIRYFNFSAVISYVQDNKMVVVLPGPQVLPELVVTGELGVQLYFDDTSYKTMFAALREVAEEREIVRLVCGRYCWVNTCTSAGDRSGAFPLAECFAGEGSESGVVCKRGGCCTRTSWNR